ncbi:MAG: ABC transporter permease subunit [Spirochaetia bacterium]
MRISLRIIFFLPSLLFISFLAFFLLEIRPGNFVNTLHFSSAQQEHIFSQMMGVNTPLFTKYLYWLFQFVIKKNAGLSFLYNQPVFDLLWQYIRPTLIFTGLIMILKWLICLPMALWSTLYPYTRRLHFVIDMISQVSMASPEFLSALFIFSLAIFMPFLMNYLFLIGIFIATFHSCGMLFQLLRTRFQEIQQQPFFEQLQLQGLSKKIEMQHLLRHAWPQILLVFSQDLPWMFSGGLIISMIFNIPTLGPFFHQAILAHDTNLAMGILMFLALMMQGGYLISDIILEMNLLPIDRTTR